MNRHFLPLLGAAVLLAAGCSHQPPRVQKNWTPGKQASVQGRLEVRVVIPSGAKYVRAWISMPQEEPGQVISDWKVESPFPTTQEIDSEGNKQLYVGLRESSVKEFTVVQTFSVSREEILVDASSGRTKPLTDEERTRYTAYLGANENVTLGDDVKKLAAEIVGADNNPISEARKIYDWELKNVDYWVKDPKNHKASPTGNTVYCMTNKTGNCGDFHSLYMSLCRASGVPTRMVYGSLFKPELNGKDEDNSYHCWVEFYAPEVGWVPIDVALADIYYEPIAINPDNEKLVRMTTAYGRYDGQNQKMVDYYFGNLDERRVVWSRGRDLTLSPKQNGGPVNSLQKAYVEIDGKVGVEKTDWFRKFTYTESSAR